ncbi:uncharacterized protein ATC70_001546 [Mucor velutinosus]|uniref:Uncharacterized protein n=1 Tax=Mucor velutinosus TaxID=708070 RepID=A0AAN7HUJ8_9FUNG|nr:hypothetical protein ATC70_001546 [Mucor velutinosus]
MQPQDLSKASHFTSSIDVDPNSIDFGLTSLPPASPTDQTALSTFMVEVRHRLSRLESAHAEIAQLKTALAESEAARDALAAQLAAINAQSTTNVAPTTIDAVSSNTPTPPSTTSASKSTPSYSQSQVTAQPSFAAVVASNTGAKRKKKPAARPPPPSATKASATLARLFAPQSDIPSGYQFVYYATPVRRRLSELRRLVQGVGLNNSRVLDIQYPLQNVIFFLFTMTIMAWFL